MIESLPDRHLTEKEVDKLRESEQFKEIYIRGRSLGPHPGTVEELVITFSDGSEKEIGYFWSSGCWEVLEPTNPDSMNCALCNSTEVIHEDSLAMGWDEYLLNERDFYIFSSVTVPYCDSCSDRWFSKRHGYKGYSPTAEEASELLDDLILDNLIQRNDMGKKIEEADNSGM